jgi:hypothetical protein
LMRPEQVGVAAIARAAREREASRRRQVMAQYSGTFETSAMGAVEKTNPFPARSSGGLGKN